MNASKILIVIAVLILGGVGFVLFQGGDDDAPPGGVGPAPVEQKKDNDEPKAKAMVTDNSGGTNKKAERQVVETETQRDPDSYAQGVQGRVVDPFGTPIGEATVYLMEGAGQDIFKVMQMQARGVQIPPLAAVKTDRYGKFKIGLANVDASKVYEVRVPHDRFVEASTPNIHIKENEWFDAKDIKLTQGAVLVGRVTVEGSGGVAVPDASVFVSSTGLVPSLSPTPGRENGIEVKCDASGHYRFENVQPGIVTVSAVAPGFARVEKPNTSIESSGETTVAFELPRGHAIKGMVTDATGKPIPGARVDATSISSKMPSIGNARTDREGRFDIIGLLEGPYIMAAVAPGFVRNERKPINAGDHDVHIVLEEQGTARIRVLSKSGAPMSRFYLTVKRQFPGQEQYGNTDISARWARHGSEGYYEVKGLNPESEGGYVFQVEAEAHCKTFSEPFKIVIGEEPPLVEVQMSEGGSVEGVVYDQANRPLAGVQVITLPDHFQDNAIMKIFGSMIPYKVTRTGTKTDDQGRYRMALLTPGTYQLKFEHPEYYDVHVRGNAVVEGQPLQVKQVRMRKGTLVTGRATVDGVPAAQVKVTISTIPDPDQQEPQMSFSDEVISDNKGNFVFAKRVPPGKYQVMAARQTLANPLLQIADFAKTKQEIMLGPGQTKFFLQVAITTDGQ